MKAEQKAELNVETAIEVENVTKSFKVYYDKGSQLKEKALFWKRNRYEERLVLKGISFTVKKGEAVGLIGHNGCGKSTTLKLLTKIIYPDQGTIEMKGRVSSLIELGAGFHPDMSGRENIYTNASIFGLTKKEIDARVEDIIAFSELEEFIDNPVRTYSSGMYMRLAFSVAINVDADILLIDEILAVGDANFQAKCFNRLREIKKDGTTIVIVSHSLGQIEQICDRSLWIQDGLIKLEGKPRDVHPEYLNYMGEERQRIAKKEEERQRRIRQKKEIEKKQGKKDNTKEPEPKQTADENKEESIERILEETGRYGNRAIEIISVKMLDSEKVERTVFRTGEEIEIVIGYRKNKEVDSVVVGLSFTRSDDIYCYGTNTLIDQINELSLQQEGEVHFKILDNNLLEGEYSIQAVFHSEDNLYYDFMKKAMVFCSYPAYADIGVARIRHEWNIDGVIYQVDDSKEEKVNAFLPVSGHEITAEELEQKKLNDKEGFFVDYSWYAPEDSNGQVNLWTNNKNAKIYIKNKGLDLSLSFVSSYPKDDLNVNVFLGEKEIFEQTSCKDEKFQIEISNNELSKEEWLEIAVQTNLLWKPSELFGNIDSRMLGVCFTGFHWAYYLDTKLERKGLKVQINPLSDHINRESNQEIQVRVENISEKGQIFSSLGNYPVMLVYRILDLEEKEIIHDGERTAFSDVLQAGDSEVVTLNCDFNTLEKEQYYWLELTLVQENVLWFDEVDPENSARIYIR